MISRFKVATNLSRLCSNLSTMKNWDYDVLVSGGGVVGAAFAADVLNKAGDKIKVGIIENKPPLEVKLERSQPDVRVYALSPKSIRFLKDVGAWKYMEHRSHPYKQMQIWETSGPGLVRFKSQDIGAEELGRMCEDVTIQAALYQSMREAGHTVDFIHGSSISDVRITAGDMNTFEPAVVTITKNKPPGTPPGPPSPTDSRVVTTRLLVGADGGMSTVRRLSGISTWGWGYGQEAVVATVRLRDVGIPTVPTKENKDTTDGANTAPPSSSTTSRRPVVNDTAWQRYLPTGPLALLPLWDGYCSIVWSTSVPEVRRLKGLSKEAFLTELNAALQSPSATDRWSVLEPSDATGLPPFLNMMVERAFKTTHPFAEEDQAGRVLGRGPNILQRIKREVAAVADTAMSAALLSDPFRSPPVVSGLESARLSFPLSFSQASSYVSPRVALIGDAAHSIHPQAGQGLNLGLLDAECLSEAVIAALRVGVDCGDEHHLRRHYHDRRSRANLLMMGTVDCINRAFSDGGQGESGVYGAENRREMGDADGQQTAASVTAASVGGDCANASGGDVRESPMYQSYQQHTQTVLQHTAATDSSTHNRSSRGSSTGGSTGKQFLRSLGMLAVHGLGPAKNRMAMFAMGIDREKDHRG